MGWKFLLEPRYGGLALHRQLAGHVTPAEPRRQLPSAVFERVMAAVTAETGGGRALAMQALEGFDEGFVHWKEGRAQRPMLAQADTQRRLADARRAAPQFETPGRGPAPSGSSTWVADTDAPAQQKVLGRVVRSQHSQAQLRERPAADVAVVATAAPGTAMLGLYPIVTMQHRSTTLYHVSYQIQYLSF